MKIGVIDVGGGYRGIFSSGVFDYFMDQGITFDLGIGISAGSANLSSFLAGQRGRNYKFITEYGQRKEYASWHNFFFKRSFLDLDYIYNTLGNSDGENPLDYPVLSRNPMEFVIVATDAKTGEPVYFTKDDLVQDDYDVMKASCAIPFACHPYKVKGKPYYDGALSDSIPVEKAFAMGCDKVVLILTKPIDEIRTSKKDERFARMIQLRYPAAAKKLRERAALYNDSLELAKRYAEEGKVIIIAPDDTCGVDTLTKDPEKLDKLYRKGYEAAKAVDFNRIKELNYEL